MGQGAIVKRLKSIGRGRGGHSREPNPYLIMVIVVLRSKASESCCRSGKSDLGECIKLASMTPGNKEYPKYDPTGMQNSCDALTKSIFYTLLPFSQNVRRKLVE
jgi:hypothetical protein